MLISNSLFFGAALLILFVLSFVLSRQTGRVLEVGLYAANKSDRAALSTVLRKKTARVAILLTTVLSLALITAGTVCTIYKIDVAPRVWAWFEASFLVDREALAWLLGELLALLLAAVYLRRALRGLIGALIGRLQQSLVFLQHTEQLARLNDRADALLRWGMVIAAITAASVLLNMPAAFNEALIAVTYVVLTTLVARTLVVMVNLGVDVGVQLVRALEDRPGPLRLVGRIGRIEHLAGITKRTLEYFVFVGAATFVVHNLRPDTWLSEFGIIAIRLIALIYVGRVAIEVIGLLLREVLLANPEQRSEAENQQRLTLVPVANSVLRYAVYFSMIIMGLQEIGVDTSPILAGAGLLGLAVGLGAQTLVGDIVAGFFILFEGIFLVGDRIRVGEAVGTVEEIGIRLLKIRDEYGVLHCIPNGEVRQVANHARDYVNAVVEFSLPYDEDIPTILEHLRSQLSEKRSMHPDILSDTDFSIQGLLDTGALIRSLTRVKPSCDDSVGDVIRVELFSLLTALGVTPSACYVIKMKDAARAPFAAPGLPIPARSAAPVLGENP